MYPGAGTTVKLGTLKIRN